MKFQQFEGKSKNQSILCHFHVIRIQQQKDLYFISESSLLRRWVFFFVLNQEMIFLLLYILKRLKKGRKVWFDSRCFHWLAYGRFESPEHANVLATMPAEVFLQVYSGEASVALISRMIFRGKISVYLEGCGDL